MRKLALSDEILMKVDKPARYIGNEFNSVMKDTSQVNIRFAMCFPDVYEIGMSHLGIQILYDMFNRMDDVWCERVYSPWPDLHEIMKQENIPLFGLESQEPIKDFDFVAMTLQYEMCYTNILQILDLAQIPLRSRDREDGCPIVIAGGPCTYNPEPIADFFDIFQILFKKALMAGFDQSGLFAASDQIGVVGGTRVGLHHNIKHPHIRVHDPYRVDSFGDFYCGHCTSSFLLSLS